MGQASAFERMNRGFGSAINGCLRCRTRKQPTTKTKPSYLASNAKPQTKLNIFLQPILQPSDTSNLQEGQKVEHQKFGFGEVMKMEGAAHNPIATVKFELNGEKKIMLNYAKLRILE